MTNRIPLIVNAGDAQIQELSSSDNLIVSNSVLTGNIYTDGYYYANGQPFGGGGNGAPVFVSSNVTAVVAGQPLVFEVDYSNISYPGGVFTLSQNSGPTPPTPTLAVSDTWASGGTSKDQFTDFSTGDVNTQNILLTLTLTNSSFNIQASDTISIGPSIITGANLLGLGISGAGGTYVIPANLFSPTVQTNLTTGVSVSLTTLAGVLSGTGTTLSTVAPVPFNITTLAGSFPNSSVTPENANQSFNWAVTGVTGTIVSGTVTLSGSQSATLTNVGATSGQSQIYDSTIGPFNLTGQYTGTGTNGAGTTTVNLSGSVTPATGITPLYWKTTTSGLNPNFTIADNRYNVAYAPNAGQGASTTNVTTNWLWIAIPAAGPGPVPPFFKFDQPPFIGITTTGDGFYNNQTIGGALYNVYGFTNYSLSVFIYTTST